MFIIQFIGANNKQNIKFSLLLIASSARHTRTSEVEVELGCEEQSLLASLVLADTAHALTRTFDSNQRRAGSSVEKDIRNVTFCSFFSNSHHCLGCSVMFISFHCYDKGSDVCIEQSEGYSFLQNLQT
jgi:hypothetical protein